MTILNGDNDKPSRLNWRSIPVLVGTIFLLTTVAATVYVDHTARMQDDLRFESAVRQATQILQVHLDTYINPAWAAGGLFAASTDVTEEEFCNFIASLRIESQFPGITALGFVQRIDDGNQGGFEPARHALEGMGPQSTPPSDLNDRYDILYIEPRNARNAVVKGFDKTGDPVRLAAMHRARDTGAPAASACAAIMPEANSETRKGFLVYVPVYRGGTIPESITARRALLSGYTFCKLSTVDLLNSIIATEMLSDIGFRICDGDRCSDDSCLYGRHEDFRRADGRLAESTIHIAGHMWTVQWWPGPQMHIDANRHLAPLGFLGGLLICVLLTGLSLAQVRARHKAHTISGALTERVRELRVLYNAASLLQGLHRRPEEVLQEITDLLPSACQYADLAAARLSYGDRIFESGPLSGHGPRIKAIFVTDEGSRSTIEIAYETPTMTFLPEEQHLLNVVADMLKGYLDRKHAEAARIESHQFLQATLDSLASRVVILDSDGRILSVNAAWRRLAEKCNRVANHGVGHHYLSVCPCADGPGTDKANAVGEGLRQVLAGEREEYMTEYTCAASNRCYIIKITRFAAKGPVRAVVSHLDITARKRVEAAEREQRNLQEAVKAMEQVLGVVGHELRTPLAGLRAMSEVLLDEDIRGTDEGTHFLQAINDEVIRMSAMVNNLLEAARITSGRAQWNWSKVSLEEVCRTVLATVRPLIDPRQVQLRCQIEPQNLSIQGDSDAIRRLILNLLDNARKHTTEGSIAIRVRELNDRTRRWVEIEIKDTGTGIAPEITGKLGQAFALNSGIVGSSHVKGSGLGLAICKGVAAAHGGALAIRSMPGKGTIVTVCLRADLDQPMPVKELTIHQEIAATEQPGFRLTELKPSTRRA